MLTSQAPAQKTRTSAVSGRPRRACTRCKSQKVRCSGDRPSCSRCSRLKRTCGYGIGPDDTHQTTPSPSSITVVREKGYHGVPLSLLPVLVEVFYSRVYNASLLLHRASFLQTLAARTASPHVVLSICAIAARFYLDAKGHASLVEEGLHTDWAERASKLVFQEVENPTEDNLITFVILALFWYSQGAWRRAHIHKGNAVQTTHLLGLGNETRGKGQSLDSEVRRRRFWACHLVNCHAADSVFINDLSESTPNLPLPWPEEDFDAGYSNRDVVSLSSGRTNDGIYCEMIKAMTLWFAVYVLINSPETSTKSRVTAIHSLDDRISEWWSSVSPSIKLSPASVFTTDARILPKLVMINAVYHQCLCALHSSIVPLFSWSAGDNGWGHARQLSAQIAYDHACVASAIAESVLSRSSDTSAIPSIVAYTAYCGCAIQMPFLWSLETKVRERAQANVRTNIKLIRSLGEHWKFSALLEVHAQYLYKKHEQNPIVLEDEPKYLDVNKLQNPRTAASHAKTSILGHNRILWAKDTGYTKQGEEVTDLGIEYEEDVPVANGSRVEYANSNSNSNSDTEANTSPSTAPNLNHLAPPANLQQPQSFGPGSETGQYLNANQPPFLGTESFFPPNEIFQPYTDAEMLDIFPHGEIPYYDYADVAPFNMDFFDNWSNVAETLGLST